jgi:hypothetical protein
MTRTRRQRTASIALALLIAFAVTSCGQSAQVRTCDRLDGVRSAVQDLRNLSLGENGMVAMQDGLGQVPAQLDLLRSELATDLQPQVDAVKTSVQQFQNTVAAARANPTAASLSAVQNNLDGVRSTVTHLGQLIAATC